MEIDLSMNDKPIGETIVYDMSLNPFEEETGPRSYDDLLNEAGERKKKLRFIY